MTRTTNTARHLRNVKHVSSIAMIQSGIDDYLANLKATSHRAANRNTLTPAPKFSPARTSNPEVADQWEARVQELHAKTLDLLETLEIGSLCALGGGLPLPVKNALQYFNQELSTYFKNA